jgi:hypothetical protein
MEKYGLDSRQEHAAMTTNLCIRYTRVIYAGIQTMSSFAPHC